MRPRISILIALVSVVLGLVRPHPCPAAPAPAASACHESRDQESPDAGDCDVACKKACQPSLVLAPRLPEAGALVPVLDAPRALAARTLPLLAHPIDHVPLA